jgi:hypothetical protein
MKKTKITQISGQFISPKKVFFFFFLFDAQKGHSTTNWDTAERHEKHGDDKEINSRTNA